MHVLMIYSEYYNGQLLLPIYVLKRRQDYLYRKLYKRHPFVLHYSILDNFLVFANTSAKNCPIFIWNVEMPST